MNLLRAARNRGIVIILVSVAVGCGGHHYWVGRYVDRSAALHARELPMTTLRARVHMEHLEVWVWTRSLEKSYQSTFALEERYVALATMAVARSEVVFDQRWTVMDLEVWNSYGKGLFPPSGTFMVTLSREDMERIRSGQLPVDSVPFLWRRLLGVKQGPDHELIEWPAGMAEPLRTPGE
jgi:hypothetical protein